MVTATVWELRRGDIDDALAGTTRHLMYKTHKVLIGIAETHTTAYAALEERC